MLKGLKTQLSVIFSLILREARVRHGRTRFGYVWAIIEPAALIMFLTLLFSQFRATTATSVDFATFFATGVLPWNGGVFVTDAPHLLWLKDTDGDGVSDLVVEIQKIAQ